MRIDRDFSLNSVRDFFRVIYPSFICKQKTTTSTQRTFCGQKSGDQRFTDIWFAQVCFRIVVATIDSVIVVVVVVVVVVTVVVVEAQQVDIGPFACELL